MLRGDFSHLTYDLEDCPKVSDLDFPARILNLCNDLMRAFRQGGGTLPARSGYRINIKLEAVEESQVARPFLECDPVIAWDRKRASMCGDEDPVSPLAPEEPLAGALFQLLEHVETFIHEERRMANEEKNAFLDQYEQLKKNPSISSKLFGGHSSHSCDKELGGRRCTFKVHRSQYLYFGRENGGTYQLIKESSEFASKMMIVANPHAPVHTNEEMVSDVGFWAYMQSVLLALHGDGCFPFMVNLNFGEWESVIARNRNLTECHGHCHILLTRKAAIHYNLSKAPEEPNFYREDNIERIVKDRTTRAKLLVSRFRHEQVIARNNQLLAELRARNNHLIAQNNQLLAELREVRAQNNQLLAELREVRAQNNQLLAELRELRTQVNNPKSIV